MSLLLAKNYLKKYGLEKDIIEFNTSTATVEEAALAIGCCPDEIAKSLAFLVNDQAIVVVVSGNSRIDNAKFKKEFGVKAKMIAALDVESLVGHAVGGVCPFGLKDNVLLYFDISLKKYNSVYPACGSSNSAIKIDLVKLENICDYKKYVDICKISN